MLTVIIYESPCTLQNTHTHIDSFSMPRIHTHIWQHTSKHHKTTFTHRKVQKCKVCCGNSSIFNSMLTFICASNIHCIHFYAKCAQQLILNMNIRGHKCIISPFTNQKTLKHVSKQTGRETKIFKQTIVNNDEMKVLLHESINNQFK